MSGEKKEESDEDDWKKDTYIPEMDDNYFKTIDKIKEELDKNENEVGKLVDMKSYSVYTYKELIYEKNTYIMLIQYDIYVIFYSIISGSIKGNNIYPISLPKNSLYKILNKGTIIYRKTKKDEEEKHEKPRFYAERLSFSFGGALDGAASEKNGTIYKYRVLNDIKIIDFNNNWRTQIWYKRYEHPVYFPYVRITNAYQYLIPKEYQEDFQCTFYEDILMHACKEANAVGWRAACFNDQKKIYSKYLNWSHKDTNKIFLSDNTEFEIALFDSNYVQRVEDDVDETKEDAVKLRF